MSKVIAPFLFLVAAVGLLFSYIVPALETLGTLQDLEDRLERVSTQSEEMMRTLTNLQNKYDAFPPQDVARLNRLVPDDIDAVRLIIDIDMLAEKHGLTINQFEVPYISSNAAKKDSGDPIGSAITSISCKGSYADFKAFLYELEQSLTLLDVVRLTVDAGRLDPATGLLLPTYRLDIQTYWYK